MWARSMMKNPSYFHTTEFLKYLILQFFDIVVAPKGIEQAP